ncbi:MAG: putative membrane protein YedE/YeeE [Paracoccaceae bacterium]|jgi:uncharacterized membrane protein YedE/YeeE
MLVYQYCSKGCSMDNFTPFAGLGGGLLIGAAASLFVLIYGRVLGISGILGGFFGGTREEIFFRLALLAGIVIAPLLLTSVGTNLPDLTVSSSVPMLVVAGLLVGFGTRLGNGCTSGHGVCGLARASRRSVVATVIFFATAAFTVYAVRHVFGG